MNVPRIAIGPLRDPAHLPGWVAGAVRAGGAEPVPVGEDADGLIWLTSTPSELGRDRSDQPHLSQVLADHPGLRWVQLPSAGVEQYAAAGVLDQRLVWTCAKGCYAEPVAEHAVALALAGLRLLRTRISAGTWGHQAGTSLYDRPVTILGGGGITTELLRLLAPYRVQATVVRRRPDPVPGAARTVGLEELHRVLPDALVVFLALSLTPATAGVIGAPELDLLGRDTQLVNVARGRHVDTEALVTALAEERIGGAGLDVTDPEPLPDGHPLWAEPRCIITPHTADTWDMVRPRLAERIGANVARFVAGDTLHGLVDPAAGY